MRDCAPYLSSVPLALFRILIQDPLLLLDPACLREVLWQWLSVLEQILGPEAIPPAGQYPSDHPEEDARGQEPPGCQIEERAFGIGEVKEPEGKLAPAEEGRQLGAESRLGATLMGDAKVNATQHEPIRVEPPRPIPSDLQADLTQLASLCLDLGSFRGNAPQERVRAEEPMGPCVFLRRYFFLLDLERTRQSCLLRYRDQPAVWKAYMAGLQGEPKPDYWCFDLGPCSAGLCIYLADVNCPPRQGVPIFLHQQEMISS